jgi:NAD(P)-dependent dehydrogenase (short-subunit alcohol dehydrogenase family)
VTVDTADPAAVERAVATAVGHYGRIDVIFNNAGVEGRQQPLHEMELHNWERVTAVDGSGVFHVLKYGIAAMLTTGGGAVINTSSTAGLIGQPDPAEMRERLESFNPLPGIPEPSDVAGVVAFLASDDARWITGVTIPIDGGYTAR